MNSTALSGDARGLAHVMARLSAGSTGTGTHGQATLALKSGYSERKVRSLLAELESAPDGCVRVVRRARFRPGGRGRTSDAWTMLLPGDQPAQAAGKVPEQTGTICTTNRHDLHDQPAQRAGDLIPVVIPVGNPDDSERQGARGQQVTLPIVEEQIVEEREPQAKPKRAACEKKKKPKYSQEQQAAHVRVTTVFHEAFERKTGTKPAWDGRQGLAVYKLLKTLRWKVELACERVNNAISSEWGGSTSIITIANDPDKFAELKRKGPAPRKPMQPNGGYQAPVERPPS